MRNVGSELSQLDIIWSQINRVVKLIGMKGCVEILGLRLNLYLPAEVVICLARRADTAKSGT